MARRKRTTTTPGIRKGKRANRRPGDRDVPAAPHVEPFEPFPDAGLTALQALFVLEYLVDQNATRAYLRSHPECSNLRTAGTEGWKLLKNPEIAEVIDQQRKAQYKRIQMSADEALANITRNARADLADCLHPVTGALLPFFLWPDSIRKCVKSFSIDPNGGMKVTLYDGQRANELMAQAGGKLKNVVHLEFDHAAYLGAEPPKPHQDEEGADHG